MKKTYQILLLCLSMVCFSTHVFAQVKGEIINLNIQYKVAFTDLFKENVVQGDIVEIFHENEFITYLEVVEVSPVMTKLGFLKRQGLITQEEDFKKISIGDSVLKYDQDLKMQDSTALFSKINSLEKENTRLRDELDLQNETVKKVQGESLKYKNKLHEMNQKLKDLKGKLSYITELWDQNVSIQ